MKSRPAPLGLETQRGALFKVSSLWPSRSAVTLLKEAGIPQAVVMELIGHGSEQMSQHYTHVGQEALKKSAESLLDFTVVKKLDGPQ